MASQISGEEMLSNEEKAQKESKLCGITQKEFMEMGKEERTKKAGEIMDELTVGVKKNAALHELRLVADAAKEQKDSAVKEFIAKHCVKRMMDLLFT